ncbi:hypothetical protein RclHR1_16470003 [Rhizophagus clarus]|uniref:Uncharacterized protein n=1 Tax=Rhizophagus clarus TaxID=94130 RepID=A0A2Z6QWR8_9GLOM|nr:hypothetical protein RclHR1_16470003 [Rhizophagus clarus]
MTSTLTVIGLITRLKISDKTLFGEAIYREKVSSQNYTFGIKQFTNAQNEYNEAFSEGDLVLLGGKFTLDGEKLMLAVEMACILEPKIDSNGQHLEWDPATIPSTKPFVHICTTPYNSLTSFEGMNFIKTRSSIFSSFHKDARSVNFEIGYSKSSKWFESIKDKWTKYTNFYIGGFLEAVYSSNEKNTETTYVQIDAKIIDYDIKSTQQNASTSSPQSTSTKSINNAFTKRRSQSLTNSLMKPSTISKYKGPFVLSTQKPGDVSTDSVITIDDVKNDDYPEDSQVDSVAIDNYLDNESTLQSHNSISSLLKHTTRSKKHLSDLCKDDKTDNQDDDDDQQEEPNDK